MAKSTYETLLILDSNHYARDPNGIGKQIESIVSDAGGDVKVSRLWMEQKLAYPINKHQKGTYWLVYFEGEGDMITPMNRALQLAEPVLRSLTIKLDARLVEPILSNARGETIQMSTPSESAEGEGESAEAPEAAGV